MTGAQAGDNLQTAEAGKEDKVEEKELTGSMVHLFAKCGLMRAGLPR